MTKSKILFVYKKNTLFHILICFIFSLAIALNKNSEIKALFASLSFIYLFVLILKKEFVIVASFLIFIILFSSMDFFKQPTPKIKEQYQLKIVKASTNYSIAKEGEIKYLVYFDKDYPLNSVVTVKAQVSSIIDNGNFYLFDFANYLRSYDVYFQLTVLEIVNEKIANQNLIDQFVYPLEEPAKSYVLTLLKGEKSEISETLSDMSLTYLLSISGLQINFLFLILVAFNKMFFKRKTSEAIAISIIGGYAFLLNWTLAPTRAFLMKLSSVVNHHLHLNMNSFDRFAFVFLIFIVKDPKIILRSEFIYSFTMVLTFIATLPLWQKSKQKKIIIALLAFTVLIPININQNYQLNLFLPLIAFLLTPIILTIYLLSLVVVIFIPLQNIYAKIINYFIAFLDYLQPININIVFGTMPYYLVVLFYLTFLFLLIYWQKRIFRLVKVFTVILISIVTITYFLPYVNPTVKVCFIDVGQGNATLIIEKYQKSAIMIDTGGLSYTDIATKRLIPILKGLGIKKLTAVIISHNDYDHNGALQSLNKHYKIETIFDKNDNEKFIFGGREFVNLNAFSAYDNDNDNSQVIYFKVGNVSYLLPGDISAQVEKDIIIKYPNLPVDVLNVAHHGSSTSSSNEFLSHIMPQTAIISVGYNNRYKHPAPEVLSRLYSFNVNVYRTDYNGMIVISHLKNNYKIVTKRQ